MKKKGEFSAACGMRFITRITFVVFSGILIGCIILLPPEIVFL